jgi:HAE1 family hydrophobic/amphiphilic exporter-1
MLKERTDDRWSRPLTPVTSVNLDPPRAGLEQAVSAALQNRPEIVQFQTNAEINEIDTRYFRDQTKPQIDLVGTYTAAGLAGARNTPSTSSNTSTTQTLIARVNELSAQSGLQPLNVPTTTTSGPPAHLVGG